MQGYSEQNTVGHPTDKTCLWPLGTNLTCLLELCFGFKGDNQAFKIEVLLLKGDVCSSLPLSEAV